MKFKLLKGPLKALAAATLFAGCTASATAAVFVETWTYEFFAGWSNFTPPGPVTGSDPTAFSGGLSTVLSWGTPVGGGGQSQLVISPQDQSGPPPTLQTNGAVVNPFVFTHRNRVITGDDNLSTATLQVRAQLAPLTPQAGDTQSTPPLDFFVNFFETANQSAGCTIPGTQCSDIFVLDSPGFVFDIPGSVFGPDFAGITYTATLGISGLTDLDAAFPGSCAAAGAAPGCLGFVTAEGLDTPFTASFQITARERPVPEPSSLALFGLLFVGLGAYAVRRRSA